MFFYILFFFFSLGQLGRISLVDRSINFYFYELLFLCYLAYLFLKYKFLPFKKSKLKNLYFFPLALLTSFLISTINYNPTENLYAFLYLIRTSFYFLAMIYVNYHYKKDKEIKEYLKPSILLFILITLTVSFIQYFLYPNLRNLVYLGWDPHLFRIFGVFLDTSLASAIFGMIILYLVINFKNFTFTLILRYILLISFILIGLLTYSRAFYISFLLTIFFILFNLKKIKYFFLLALIFICILFLLPRPFGEGVNLLRTFSIESRYKENLEGLKLWKNNILFGVGFNNLYTIRNSKKVIPTHSASAFPSSFITILASSGILGIITFLYAMTQIWKYSKISKYFLFFLATFSLFDNVILHPMILFLLLFFINDS